MSTKTKTDLERLTEIIESRRAFMRGTVESYILEYEKEFNTTDRDEAIKGLIEAISKQIVR